MRPLLLAVLVALGCAAVAAPALAPARVVDARRVALRTAIVTTANAPDTLVVSATWQAPGNDGKGPLDSLVVVVNAAGVGSRTTLAAGARSFERRTALEEGTSQAGQASVCVLTFRAGRQGGSLISGVATDPVPPNCGVADYQYVPPAPPPVSGVVVTARVP